MLVGVFDEAGKGLHHAGKESLLVGCQIGPRLHAWVARWQDGIGRDQAHGLLALKCLLTHPVPALIELTRIFVDVTLRHMKRAVRCAKGQVHEEWLARGHLLLIAQHSDSLLGHVFAEVVPLMLRHRYPVIV